MNVKNILKGLHKICYKELSAEKVILIHKDKKEIDTTLKKWTSELKSLAWKTDSGLLASYNRFTGTLIVKYRFKKAEIKQVCAFDHYVIFAKLVANDSGTYELRYSFVYERFLQIFFKTIGILMLCPFIFIIIKRNFFQYNLGSYIYTLVCAGIFALMGIGLFFMKKPSLEQCSKVIGLFEDNILMLL